MKLNPAVRVAVLVTAATAVIYVVGVIAVNLAVSGHLTAQANERLTHALGDRALLSRQGPADGGARAPDRTDIDADGAPVFLWELNTSGSVTAHSPGAPRLPATRLRDGSVTTANLGRLGEFILKAARHGPGALIAGQSMAGDAHTERLLHDGEAIAGPLLLLAMFGGSLAVGLRALAPVEQSRRRQLEFTADASHELRTPLSVIRAEADVALSSPREAAQYRDALTRIQAESQRLRQLVDDMLWLARFDSRPPPPGNEPVDLATLAQACADRFRAVGPAITREVAAQPALISAPPEWIDRLAGVLVDNACRYAGPGGQVRIRVEAHGNRVSLTVEDSGPGIPAEDRPRLFDRFHRSTEAGRERPSPPSAAASPRGQHSSGAGLGLAIGDSIVRSTAGRWQVGDSPLGGALMQVSWRRSQPHRSPPRMTATRT